MAVAMIITYDAQTDYSSSLFFDWLLTHWPLGDLNEIFDEWFLKLILKFIGWSISCEREIVIETQ